MAPSRPASIERTRRAALLAFLCTSSCAAVGSFQMAQTAGAGQFEVGLDVSETRPTAPLYPADWALPWLPRFGVAARYGVSDALDLSLRVDPMGVEAGVKWRLLERPFVLSLSPSIGAMEVPYENPGSEYADSRFGSLSVLADFPLSKSTTLVLAPKAHAWSFSYSDADHGPWVGSFFSVGGTAGVAIALTQHLRIIPELGVLTPVMIHQRGVRSDLGPTASTNSQTSSSVLLQAGVGIVFGGR